MRVEVVYVLTCSCFTEQLSFAGSKINTVRIKRLGHRFKNMHKKDITKKVQAYFKHLCALN